MKASQNEDQRQAAVNAARQTTSERDGALQRIVEEAAARARTPIASVSIIDRDHQWIAAMLGTDARETLRLDSLCSRVILRPGEPLVILDADQDERYAAVQEVSAAPFIRFFVGISLINRAGYSFGALCLADTVPRREMPDLTALERLAREAERFIINY
jgi:GAF domain-containing protein